MDIGAPEARGPAVSALGRALAEVKQRWSVIEWVTKNLLSRAPLCYGRHVKPTGFICSPSPDCICSS
jgi:hypothetical protein